MKRQLVIVGMCALSLVAGSMGCAQSTTSATGDLSAPDLSGELDDMTIVKGGPKADLPRPPAPDLSGIDLAQGELPPPPDLLGASLVGADSCGSAPELVPGVVYSGQDTTPMTDDYDIGFLVAASSCAGDLYFGLFAYDGRDAAYRVTVPAGKTLKVSMTNEAGSSADLALAIVDLCLAPGATCLGASDDITGTEVAVWKNTDTSSSTVFVIVDATPGTEFGKYNIKAELL